MKKKKLRSQEWFGGSGKMGFVHSSWLRNQGYPDEHFRGKPAIRICNMFSEPTPCNGHLRDFAEIVNKGVLEVGGFPTGVEVCHSMVHGADLSRQQQIAGLLLWER